MEAREESSVKELKMCLGFLKETGSGVPSSAGGYSPAFPGVAVRGALNTVLR